MFWSKIWFFIVATVAVVALTFALLMPKPAQRVVASLERQSLSQACDLVTILLGVDARNRVDLTSLFARTPEIITAIDQANGVDKIDEARMEQARGVAQQVIAKIKGRRPDFAILVDRKGRVVTRVKTADEKDPSENIGGRPIVEEALAGFLRDDLWVTGNNTLYFITAAPVVQLNYTKSDPYMGAVVLGYRAESEFAKTLKDKLSANIDVGFFIGENTVAASRTVALDPATLQDAVGKLSGGDFARDCSANEPIDLRAGTDDYRAVVARFPGEAAGKKAFYSVYAPRPGEIGFTGTLNKVTKNDLGFGSFPWPLVGGVFILMLAGGIALMLFEADRPLRRLTAEAVRLGKGEVERLSEDAHPGKFGSIARSVNIHIDKLGREAKTAKKDLDQLLGPAPEGSLGTIDLLATALPSVRPGGPGPSAPPPPSEFRFNDSGAMQARPTPPVPPSQKSGPTHTGPEKMSRPETPLPMPVPGVPLSPVGTARPTPTPPAFAPSNISPAASGSVPISAMSSPSMPAAPPALGPAFGGPSTTSPQAPPITLDDDILGASGSAPPMGAQDPYFKQVFDQFIAVKKSCNEQTTGLTYEKFTEKLVKNRDDLMSKTGCRDVRFTVYVKDGKAALKATPVKDD